MNREQRKAKKDSYETKRRERQEENERIKADFKKLSYRDKLLFTLVVQFLRTILLKSRKELRRD
jgi:formiminotetrahydrofolate cyclodeaminase